MKNLTPELIAKAKTAKSTEELLALAKDNNVEMTEEEAKIYFEQLNANGAVADDELDVVAGGCDLFSEKSRKITSGATFCFTDGTMGPVCQFNHAKVSVRGAQCLNCGTDYDAKVTVRNVELI